MSGAVAGEGLDYYTVLGLNIPPRGGLIATDEVRRAYRHALLHHHPDKVKSIKDVTYAGANQTVNNSSTSLYSIDSITAAYETLKEPVKQHDYRERLGASQALSKMNGDLETTELEAIDLDDMDFLEAEQKYVHVCRCGNKHGFQVTESDLLERAEHGQNEVLAGCEDCSHHARITFQLNGE